MTSHTLILNQDYSPLSVIPISTKNWQESMKSWFSDEAKPIEYYSEWKIHSSKNSWPVPSVMVNNRYIKKKHAIRYSRYNLLLRDNFQCQYCGTAQSLTDATVDHVIPRVKGGLTKWDNIVICCSKCNSAKGHRMILKPRNKPSHPDYYQLSNSVLKRPITIPHESWIPYLPWDKELIYVSKDHN